MKACVTFDSRYGNTEKIAKSLATGLEEAGIRATCVGVSSVIVESLSEYDLICVGGPTQYRTASKAMQDFLGSLSKVDLSGKRAFAFDTKRDSLLAGSAAKYIEGALRNRGMRIVSQRQSAMIATPEAEMERRESESKDEWKERRHGSEKLLGGEGGRFEQIGRQVGRALLEAAPMSIRS